MASDFSVAWQCLSKRKNEFFVTDQTPCPTLTLNMERELFPALLSFVPGLPDGMLSYQKSPFGYILEGLGI
jgi:hypothetical protein